VRQVLQVRGNAPVRCAERPQARGQLRPAACGRLTSDGLVAGGAALDRRARLAGLVVEVELVGAGAEPTLEVEVLYARSSAPPAAAKRSAHAATRAATIVAHSSDQGPKNCRALPTESSQCVQTSGSAQYRPGCGRLALLGSWSDMMLLGTPGT
jgi:hypothetical protein